MIVFPGEPQFGPDPGRRVPDRPTAFGVCAREGLIAVVNIVRPGGAYTDLPGGGLDPGEEPTAALVREFGEETGLVVEAGPLLARAAQFLTRVDGEIVDNRSWLYEARWIAAAPALKIESDHTLDWIAPLDALRRLRLENHVWAVAAWLRLARRTALA